MSTTLSRKPIERFFFGDGYIEARPPSREHDIKVNDELDLNREPRS
jgi:hypothetical protein